MLNFSVVYEPVLRISLHPLTHLPRFHPHEASLKIKKEASGRRNIQQIRPYQQRKRQTDNLHRSALLRKSWNIRSQEERPHNLKRIKIPSKIPRWYLPAWHRPLKIKIHQPVQKKHLQVGYGAEKSSREQSDEKAIK